MTHDQKIEIARIFGAHSEIFGKSFSEPALRLLVESLSDLHFGDVKHVLMNWVKTEKHFPMPSDIREKLKTSVTSADLGRDIASRILLSVTLDGWTNPDRARARMGEIAWAVVQREGGWDTVCRTMSEECKTTAYAQLRDLSETIAKVKSADLPGEELLKLEKT